MVRIFLVMCLVAGTFVLAGKFVSQPQPPRMQQSDDFLWKLFARCEIKPNKNYLYSVSYIPDVMALKGKRITISGFMVPLEAKEKFTHFLLSRRAPTCAFCPPGEPNEIMEVFSSKPMRWQENLITISGSLVLLNDGKNEILFQMKDAL
jgi:uncharacterized protein